MSEIKNENVVGPGMYVEYAYKLFNEADGSLLFEAPVSAPDMMVYGVSHEIVPGLIAALKGLKKGDRFGVVLPPEAAFGEIYPDNIIDLEKNLFLRDGKLAEEVKVGAELPMMTAEGYRISGRVLEITDDKVKMDFNHPFAGMTVKYDGEVVTVREATPEELAPSHGCGGCGGGCHGGSCHDEGSSCGGCGGGCCE